jgi:hypothetical protein
MRRRPLTPKEARDFWEDVRNIVKRRPTPDAIREFWDCLERHGVDRPPTFKELFAREHGRAPTAAEMRCAFKIIELYETGNDLARRYKLVLPPDIQDNVDKARKSERVDYWTKERAKRDRPASHLAQVKEKLRVLRPNGKEKGDTWASLAELVGRDGLGTTESTVRRALKKP